MEVALGTMTTLKVTVEKSPGVTIGEKLYGESVELIRELIEFEGSLAFS